MNGGRFASPTKKRFPDMGDEVQLIEREVGGKFRNRERRGSAQAGDARARMGYAEDSSTTFCRDPRQREWRTSKNGRELTA